MSIAIDETKAFLLNEAVELDKEMGERLWAQQYQAHLLQAVDALDLLEEALAEATELSDEIVEALDVSKVLGLEAGIHDSHGLIKP